MQNHNNNNERFLDEVLSTSPDYTLPDNFAGMMSLKFEKHFAWNQYIREFFVYLSAGMGILAVAVATLIFMMTETWQKWLAEFLKNPVVWIGVLVVFVFILFADKVLLKYFSYRMNLKSAQA